MRTNFQGLQTEHHSRGKAIFDTAGYMHTSFPFELDILIPQPPRLELEKERSSIFCICFCTYDHDRRLGTTDNPIKACYM